MRGKRAAPNRISIEKLAGGRKLLLLPEAKERHRLEQRSQKQGTKEVRDEHYLMA